MIPSSTNPLVLVADDEPTMLELVARHLKSMDDPKLDVIEASDGEQAWSMAREHLPDLVVLDVMMPGMSGWEVCRKIREEVALAHTGVVMLTGIGENLNEMTSPLYGADAYVDKPFEFGELDEKVKGALEARASQREGVSRPAINGVSGPARSAPQRAKKKPTATKLAPRLAKAGPRKAPPAAAPKRAPAKKASAKKVSPKKVSPKKVSPKKVSPKKVSPKKAIKTLPKKIVAKKHPPKKAPKKSGARKTAKKKR